jgi:RNA polymerase-binding protein DksA
MEREKAFLFAAREGNLLYHLDKALERVEDGTYGKCVGCGAEIGHERLEAVPHVRLCIQCKSKEEKERG